MTELTNLVFERRKKQEKYFKNYMHWAKLVKKESKRLLGEVKVFIFGSILRKNELPRDIDILIISQKLKTAKKKSEIRAEIWKNTGISSPLEIHLATPDEYKDWYKFFIKEKIEVG